MDFFSLKKNIFICLNDVMLFDNRRFQQRKSTVTSCYNVSLLCNQLILMIMNFESEPLLVLRISLVCEISFEG